jgi:2'-5' RNA ligase
MEKHSKKLLYIGIGLTQESSMQLKEFGEQILNKGIIKNFEPKFFCHHMTVCFYKQFNQDILDWSKENKGRTFEMQVTEIGFSNKAIAVKVKTKAPTYSNFKHITIATNLLTNGKPFNSNEIINWFTIDEKFMLNGTLQFFYN